MAEQEPTRRLLMSRNTTGMAAAGRWPAKVGWLANRISALSLVRASQGDGAHWGKFNGDRLAWRFASGGTRLCAAG
jgi:hypothetical protein